MNDAAETSRASVPWLPGPPRASAGRGRDSAGTAPRSSCTAGTPPAAPRWSTRSPRRAARPASWPPTSATRSSWTTCAEQAGPVDVLVNNAGFSWFGPTADLDVATFDRLFAANVRAAYFLVAALAPKMAARGAIGGPALHPHADPEGS